MLAAFDGYNQECKGIMTTIAARMQAVRSRIDAAARTAGRSPQDIRLIAVSKTFAPAVIVQAHAAGQTAFGESYLQEAIGKIAAFSDLDLIRHVARGRQDIEQRQGDVRPSAGVASPEGPLLLPLEWQVAHGPQDSEQSKGDLRPSAGVASPQAGPLLLPLEWHFIGPIQSNKTRQIAELFHWAHAIDRLKIAERLSSSRPAGLPPLQICIQINVSGEASKSGMRPEEALALAQAITPLKGVQLRGLMAIPEPTPDIGLQRARFRQIRELKDEIVSRGIALDTLSMGMSDDLEAAIAEGATHVRVGRAIFGERSPNTD
jgi:uncharacterized pyridoxal phosphate-containing UPF0001 family protein